jgi:hypothetical protein
MTDREINAAVAECCGWKHAGAHLDYGWQSPHWHGPKGECQLVLPDYANDLNAMQAAEELLLADGYLSWDYAENVCRIVATQQNPGGKPSSRFQILHATARQRAEAFLRTLGKWRETTTPATPVSSGALTGGNVQTGAESASNE